MNYKEYLETFARWNGKSGFGLDTIADIMQRLSNPQDKKPCIHVAGTNGKGSVGLMMASILNQAGYKVGYSSSPHLSRINERIIINGREIEDELLSKLCMELKDIISETELTPSFFEVMTALSFLAFRELDYAVYEVGLGGRLDATNILKKPNISIITSIAYDHEKLLGDTLEKICAEKAGLMRENSVMVVGALNPSCMEIIYQKAGRLNTKILALNRDFFIEECTGTDSGFFVYRDLKENEVKFKPSLRGQHQAENAALSIVSGIELNIPIQRCAEAVSRVFWPGRLEYLKYGYRDLILDCAHNPAGTEKLTSFLDSEGIEEVDVIYSSLHTKNWEASIRTLKKYIVNWNIVEVDSEQTVLAEQIHNILKTLDITKITLYYRELERCLEELCAIAEARPLLVTGSMYMLGEIRSIIASKTGNKSINRNYWW